MPRIKQIAMKKSFEASYTDSQKPQKRKKLKLATKSVPMKIEKKPNRIEVQAQKYVDKLELKSKKIKKAFQPKELKPVGSRFEELCLPRKPFQILVREIANTGDKQYRFESDAIKALHIVSESFLIGIMEDSAKCTAHANRKTTLPKDLALAASFNKIKYNGSD